MQRPLFCCMNTIYYGMGKADYNTQPYQKDDALEWSAGEQTKTPKHSENW